jgi:hypothetical protein
MTSSSWEETPSSASASPPAPREHGYVLEPGRIFEKPTIASLAAALAGDGAPAVEEAADAVANLPADPEAAPKPEDFPDADISQRDLDTLLSQLGGRG